jgi:ADP-heptose:LPS heptosyltransferase
VANISGIGETLATLPVIRAIEENWTNSEGYFLVNKSLPIQELFSEESFELIGLRQGLNVLNTINQLLSVKNKLPDDLDLFVNADDHIRSSYHVAVNYAEFKSGYYYKWFDHFLYDHSPRRNYQQFQGLTFLDLLNPFSLSWDLTDSFFSPPNHAKKNFQSWLEEEKISGKYLVIHPGGSTPKKFWTVQRWGGLIEYINYRYGMEFIIIEGPDEEGMGDSICESLDDCAHQVTVHRQKPLSQVAWLIEQSAGVLATDSAFFHMGIALGIPTFCIFMGNDPFDFYLNQAYINCFYTETKNRPTLEDVIPAVESWYEEHVK